MKLTIENINREIRSRGYDSQLAARTFVGLIGARWDGLSAEERGEKMCHAFEEALTWHETLNADPVARTVLSDDTTERSRQLAASAYAATE